MKNVLSLICTLFLIKRSSTGTEDLKYYPLRNGSMDVALRGLKMAAGKPNLHDMVWIAVEKNLHQRFSCLVQSGRDICFVAFLFSPWGLSCSSLFIKCFCNQAGSPTSWVLHHQFLTVWKNLSQFIIYDLYLISITFFAYKMY